MKLKKADNTLTPRDLDIMNILWNSPDALTATEIVKQDTTLTSNTVQAVLRKLLKNKLIEVADIVYSGTVLCRRYKPSVTAEAFAKSRFATELKLLSEDIPVTSLMAAFLELEKDPAKAAQEIEELETLLQSYKKQLNKK